MSAPVTYVCGKSLTSSRDYCKARSLGFPSHFILPKSEALRGLSATVTLLLVDGFWDRPDAAGIVAEARIRRMKIVDESQEAV